VSTGVKRIYESRFFLPVVLVLIVGVVYLSTLLPGVGYSGDTAKFQFVGRTLGTPHATGYPTYLFLNYLFTGLYPFGSLAYKANLLSALFAIASYVLLFRILLLFGVERGFAFAAALALALTRTVWSQSLIAEVYTLNLLFVALVLYFFLLWDKTRRNVHLLLACAFYALSFGNHLTMVTFLPAIIYFVWVTDRKSALKGKNILWICLFIIVSALQYSYLFWRYYAGNTPYLEMVTPDLKHLLWYLTGAQFKDRLFQFTPAQILTIRIPLLLERLITEYLFLFPVAILGALRLKPARANVFLLLCAAANILFALNYGIPDIACYFIPTHFIVLIYVGVGLQVLKRAIFEKRPQITLAVITFIPIVFFASNYARVNQRNNTEEARKVRAALAAVKEKAFILAPDYNYFEYFDYYLIGEGLRRNDIYLVHYFAPQRIKDYLYNHRPFFRPYDKEVPPGLTVYYFGSAGTDAVTSAGLRLSAVSSVQSLYKIEP
jgi:hypothetical protein